MCQAPFKMLAANNGLEPFCIMRPHILSTWLLLPVSVSRLRSVKLYRNRLCIHKPRTTALPRVRSFCLMGCAIRKNAQCSLGNCILCVAYFSWKTKVAVPQRSILFAFCIILKPQPHQRVTMQLLATKQTTPMQLLAKCYWEYIGCKELPGDPLVWLGLSSRDVKLKYTVGEK